MQQSSSSGTRLLKSLTFTLVTILALNGCSSGGSSNPKSVSSRSSTPAWQQNVYPDPDIFYKRCATPRSGQDPLRDQPYDETQGTLTDEKMWLRSVLHDLYLWTDLKNEFSPAGLSLEANFLGRLYEGDRFSSMLDEASFVDQFTDGTDQSFGVRWQVYRTDDGQGGEQYLWIVADIDPASPLMGSVQRGNLLVSLDGTDTSSPIYAQATFNALLSPEEGDTRDMTFMSVDTQQTFSITATAQTLAMAPVGVPGIINGDVGYLPFHDHNAAAESQLIEAVADFQSQGITDLVLDLRYNRGGLLYIASQLSYMIAGPERTEDKVFERVRYNDNYGVTDPFTGEEQVLPFYSTSPAGAEENIEALPTLNLSRLYVLTGYETCSASESIINGLQGIDIEVVQIGDTTCGKPYGSKPIANCGTVYSPVMFAGTNQKGYGGFTDGFIPTEGSIDTPGQAHVPGCAMLEDFAAPLGSTEENLLSAALYYRENGTCPPSETTTQAKERPPTQRYKPGTNLMDKTFNIPVNGHKILL